MFSSADKTYTHLGIKNHTRRNTAAFKQASFIKAAEYIILAFTPECEILHLNIPINTALYLFLQNYTLSAGQMQQHSYVLIQVD